MLGRPGRVTRHDGPWAMAGADPNRVLYVCLQGLEPGQGAETHVRAVVDGLRGRHEVVVVAPAGSSAVGVLGRGLRLARLLWAAKRAAHRADVVYLRHHPVLVPLTWWLRRRGIPQVQEVNGPTADYTAIYPMLRPICALLRWSSRTSLRHAQQVVAVSDALAAAVRAEADLPPDRVVVVHNGADLAVFVPSDVVGPYVVFVGALTPWQGLSTLAAATTDPAWPTGITAVVVGDGPSRPQLDAAASEVLDQRGVLSHREVGRLVAGSLAALSPKTAEARWSSPLKVYEAIAAGVPCVVTDVGEQADLVRRLGCGIVVPTGDPSALASAVRRLATDRAERDAFARAAADSRDETSWESRTATLSTLLDGVADSGGVAA